MAFNGTGTYIPITPPDFPAVAGTTIRATQYNNQVYDFAAALTAVICKDGQTTPTANLPMGNFRHTGVGAATARTQYARAAEVQDGALTWLTSVAGADTITAVASAGMLAYVAGQAFKFAAAAANTGAVTLNINSIGAKGVKDSSGNALTAGELTTGRIVSVVYNGTEFRLLEANVTKATANFIAKTAATGSFPLPAGTTGERDGSPALGYLRFNSTLTQFEGYNGSAWTAIGTGVTAVLHTSGTLSTTADGNLTTLKLTTLQNQAGTKSIAVDTVIDGSAKAWANFNGTGTVAIRKAFNVSSITDNGTGDYTVNFTTPMPDTDYVISAISGGNSGSGSTETSIFTAFGAGGTDPTVSGFRLRCTNAAGTVLGDPDRVCVTVFD